MIKIKKLEEKQDVYDIQVPETQNFYATNILVHNCEIFQATTETETAICTLSSLVLKNFIIDGKFDFTLLYNEVRKVVRSLNKVIDVNSYSTDKGRKGGLEQRAIAIGTQGLADVFYIMDYVFTSDEAKKLNKQIFETIYFAAITESKDLCKYGKYAPYKFFNGSPMSEGIFQYDMWGLTEDNLTGMWDWRELKNEVKQHGICNSLFTAQMPVACQTSDTKIITEEGVLSFREICEMNNINVDEVESEKMGGVWFNFEKPLSVKTMDGYHLSNKIYYNGHTEIYNIEMEDGSIFKCSSEHKFLVEREGQQEWVKVKDIEASDRIVNLEKGTMKVVLVIVQGVQPVWDIEVDEVHHYITENGCVSHNSSAKITGSFEMTEPAHSALFNRRVVGGEILIVNKYLINDFEKLGIWGEELKNEIILNEGSIQNVNFNNYLDSEDKNYTKKVKRIEYLIQKYKTIWEISQRELINMAADRAPFIDQSQSMNIYMGNPTLSKITSSHFHAWEKGLKTLCYYVRTKAISTGAKHLAIDITKTKQPVKKTETPTVNITPSKPSDSPFECFGCSS